MCDDLSTLPRRDASGEDDPVLRMYRESHEAVARYTLKLADWVRKTETPVESGLTWKAATDLRDRLEREQKERLGGSFHFGDPVYVIQLENEAEALAAMRAASAEFWRRRAS